MENAQFKVEDTNLEALRAKKSAIDRGYMQDSFVRFFVPETIKKEVLLHHGYWARFWCFNSFARSFLRNAESEVQILSIGCGLDTLPFNLLNLMDKQLAPFSFYECDLESVVKQKIGVIKGNQQFSDFLTARAGEHTVSTGKLIRERRITLKPEIQPLLLRSQRHGQLRCSPGEIRNQEEVSS